MLTYLPLVLCGRNIPAYSNPEASAPIQLADYPPMQVLPPLTDDAETPARQPTTTRTMVSVDRLSALQDRRIASLSHTTTLIIIHDDSEAVADATRQALQLHRAGRSCIEVPLQNGFALVAEGDRGHAPAAAGAIASFPPAQPADPSSGDGGGSSGSSSGGDSNSQSESPSESGDGFAEVFKESLLMHRELLRLAPDRGFQSTEPASKRRRTVKLKSRGNWVPWGPTEQDGTTQCARGRPDWRHASGAQREYGVRGSPGQQVGVEAYSHAYSSYSHAYSALSAAEARERAYYAQQEREQTQAMVAEAAAQGRARVGTSRDHVVDAEDAIDTPPSTPLPASPARMSHIVSISRSSSSNASVSSAITVSLASTVIDACAVCGGVLVLGWHGCTRNR